MASALSCVSVTLLWLARSGARWRDLPERFGNYQAVKRRYYRLIARAALSGFLKVLAAGADLEWLLIDSTIVRAHQHAAGARTDKRRADAQGLGRSCGGLNTKPHAATDALGNPVRLLLGPGQRHDVTRSHELIDGLQPGAVIADKGYDADHLRQTLIEAGTEPVIPPRSNRRAMHAYDRVLYKERSLIERFFNKLKQFRRVATRYDKLLPNYKGLHPTQRPHHFPEMKSSTAP